MTPPPTASQTVGPFFHIGLTQMARGAVRLGGASGERVTIEGRIVDGDGTPVPDALVEIWQADPAGRYPAESVNENASGKEFQGFARVESDHNGEFRISTLKPGRVPFLDGTLQAPHIVVTVFSRGLLKPLLTRMYFPAEAANSEDPILKLVPPERRSTLIARSAEGAQNPAGECVLEWNVAMQGEGETVFFDS